VKLCYLGIDGGSVSLKFALIDEKGKILSSVYLRNQGIIETVQSGLKAVAGKDCEVAGVCVTGSGRKFIGTLVGADLVESEVLAHTIAALHYFPGVRTLIDIGGEDSKIMSIRDGILEDFRLNSVCGAGTGSLLDAIGSRIGVRIEDVGNLALQSRQRLYFPGKCGIFAQSSVVSRLNSGAHKSDILMGMIRALVNNYLTIAKGMDLAPPFVYQGATAQNKAMHKALEEQLESSVAVPDQCALMGAIGAALLARDEKLQKTGFHGFALSENTYTTQTIFAQGCNNNCELTLLFENGRYLGTIGNRCAKCQSLTQAAREQSGQSHFN
jgi:predicted CoA-substrate-specific enzyme activase